MTHDYDLDEDDDEDRPGYRDEDWPHSGVGVASFITGLVVLLMILAGFGLVVMAAVQAQNSGMPPPMAWVGIFLLIGASIFAVVGTGLGIGALFQRRRKKVFGIIGLSLNVLVLLGGLALVLVGVVAAMGSIH
jgi:hypothetical protein